MRFLILISILITNYTFSQNSLRAYMDVKTFHTPNNDTYVEVFNKVNINGLVFKQINNGQVAKVKITQSILKNDSLIIQKIDTLISEVIVDSLYNDLFLLNTFKLKPGKFNIIVEYKDLFNELNSSSLSNKTDVEIYKLNFEKNSLSNIQIADYINKTSSQNQFSKYGYDIFPHLGNYFSSDCIYLPFYYEIYSNINNNFKIRYEIVNSETNKTYYKFIDSTIEFRGIVTPVIHTINIKNIPTGNYNLNIYDDNKISKTSFNFYRYNEMDINLTNSSKILDPSFHKSLKSDSLIFFAKSLMPIMYNEDQKILLKILNESDTSKIRVFIESFWVSTSLSNPYEEWLKYKNQVILIEKLYKTHNVHGFETERGRVYLKYGPPTAIRSKESSPSEYPYEIWQYDKIKNFSNKRFVFYNPDIVGNNYRLLHSDMLGEIKNFKWPGLLTKRNNSTINVDDPLEGGFDHFGSQSRDIYNQY
jgi:GWxTD domain-containing protein